jgi:hypothetical protein
MRVVVGLVRAGHRMRAALLPERRQLKTAPRSATNMPTNDTEQRRTASGIVMWGAIFGILLAVVVIIAAVRLAPDAQVKSNASDQPSQPATNSTNRETTGATGGNTGTSGNATRQGSGAAGSGKGSPTGSSTNVPGSNPAGHEDTTSTGTR